MKTIKKNVFFLICIASTVTFARSSVYNTSSVYSNTYTSTYTAPFGSTPSTYSWESMGTWTQTTLPQRGVPTSPLSTPSGILLVNTSAPNCTAASYNDIYTGVCSTANTSIPYVGVSVLGSREGVKCTAGDFKFTVNYTTSAGAVVRETLSALLPQSDQYTTTDPSVGSVTVGCASLKRDNQTGFSIPGKSVKGNAKFQCVAGEWRMTDLSCNDIPASCGGGGFAFSYNGYSGNASLPPMTEGQTVGTDCSVLGAPPTNYVWSGGLNYYCNASGSVSLSGGTCSQIYVPPAPTVPVYVTNYNADPACGAGVMSVGVYTYALGYSVYACADTAGSCKYVYDPTSNYSAPWPCDQFIIQSTLFDLMGGSIFTNSGS